MFSVYKDKNSEIPKCFNLTKPHNAHILTHETCAWSEGWSTFVGLWVTGKHQYTSFANSYDLNFEQTTKDGIAFPTTSPSITEGWITATLLDIIDTTNEPYDDMSSEDQKLWNAFKNNGNTTSAYNSVAGSIYEFEDDWNAEGYPSLQNIFFLNKLADAPVTAPADNATIILHENFESDLSQWTLTGDDEIWEQRQASKPGDAAGNKVGHSANCDDVCVMTSGTLDVPAGSELSFWRYVSSSIDNGEGLRVDVSTNGTGWSEIAFYSDDNDKDDSAWHEETFDLTQYASNTFKIRFTAISSSISEAVQLDDIIISAPSHTVIFEDSFADLSKWTGSGTQNWKAPPAAWYEERPAGTFAAANDCDTPCIITSDAMDLSGYNSTSLSIKRFVDSSADSGEYLRVEGFDGTSWSVIFSWGQDTGDDDDSWNTHTADLSDFAGASDFRLRISAVVSSSSEDVGVTDVVITGSSSSGNNNAGTATATGMPLNEAFDDLSAWKQSGDMQWSIVSSWREDMPPKAAADNKFLVASNCDNSCTLELSSGIDMSRYTKATLELVRFVDSSLDNGEYLQVYVFDGTAWHMLAQWGDDSNTDTDVWEAESLDVTRHIDTGNFKIKLVTKQTSSSEDVGVDNLKLLAS
jgi:hypothetical protein